MLLRRACGGLGVDTSGHRSRALSAFDRTPVLPDKDTHHYRVSYPRLLEIQARLRARFLNGEIDDYPVFVTR